MIWSNFAGIAQIVTGLGIILIVFAFVPSKAKQIKELDFGPIKLALFRPIVFASGALLCGVGLIASGSLLLIERLV